jgi:hypothetical protein
MAKINFDPQSPVIAVDITLESEGGIKKTNLTRAALSMGKRPMKDRYTLFVPMQKT